LHDIIVLPSLGILLMMSFSQPAIGVFAALVAIFVYLRFLRSPRVPLPPGPPGEPILGHLRIIPANNPERAYKDWSREYNSEN
jgi:hypothetical protein